MFLSFPLLFLYFSIAFLYLSFTFVCFPVLVLTVLFLSFRTRRVQRKTKKQTKFLAGSWRKFFLDLFGAFSII